MIAHFSDFPILIKNPEKRKNEADLKIRKIKKMSNCPDHFLFFSIFFGSFKYVNAIRISNISFFSFLLEKCKIRLAEVCTDPFDAKLPMKNSGTLYFQ